MGTKDETKGTPGTNPDGTPKDETKGTPKDKGKLYTTVEIDKIKADAAGMGQGRAEKIAKQEKDALEEELKSLKSRQDASDRERDEDRLAEARGDDDKMRAYQREQAVAKRERQADDDRRDLTRQQGSLKTAQEELKQSQGTVSVGYLAAKHGIPVEKLEKYSKLDPEELEALAEDLAGGAKPKGEDDKGDKGDESLKLDDGSGSGSGEKTEQERLDERYPTMKTK